MLITHDKDKAALTMMNIDSLIETDFLEVRSDLSLGDFLKVITHSKRNIFPVIDNDIFKGIVFINDIRHLILKTELYDIVRVKDLMYTPTPIVKPSETMDDVVRKFRNTQHYNLPVIDNDRYIGFVSEQIHLVHIKKLLASFLKIKLSLYNLI